MPGRPESKIKIRANRTIYKIIFYEISIGYNLKRVFFGRKIQKLYFNTFLHCFRREIVKRGFKMQILYFSAKQYPFQMTSYRNPENVEKRWYINYILDPVFAAFWQKQYRNVVQFRFCIFRPKNSLFQMTSYRNPKNVEQMLSDVELQ